MGPASVFIKNCCIDKVRASQVTRGKQTVHAGHAGSIPGSEDPLEEEIETHSSILAWRIPWTGEPGGLQSVGLQKIGQQESKYFRLCGLLRQLDFCFSVRAAIASG